ncbi:TetR/AcrR family transcriptional regulator [Pseudomonas poae]|nr:TetR/AcrR family transcriptional regulator [Pseudomonas poae]
MDITNTRPSTLQKKEALLDVACELFLTKGYAAVSIDEVVARVSQSKTNVYSWFGGKRELFMACVRRMLQVWVEHLRHDYSDMAPQEALYGLGKKILELVLSERAVILHRLVIAESVDFPEVAQAWMEAGPVQSYQLIAELLDRFQHRGDFREVNSLSGAKFFHDLLLGDMQLQIMLGIRQPPTEAEIERHLERVLDLFITGYQTLRNQ